MYVILDVDFLRLVMREGGIDYGDDFGGEVGFLFFIV